MKKIISILLIFTCMLSAVACEKNSSDPATAIDNRESDPATIIDNRGNEISLTAKELRDIYNENETKFESFYYGAEITFTGTVKKIKDDFFSNGSSERFDSIEFEEGWTVYLLHGWNQSVLLELSKGSKVKVKTNIFSCFGNTVDLRGMGSIGYTRDSLKETSLEIVA